MRVDKIRFGSILILIIFLNFNFSPIISKIFDCEIQQSNIKLSKDDSFSLDKEFTIKLFIKYLHRTDFSDILTLFFSNTSYGNYQENLWISPFLKIISPPPDTSL